MPFPEAGIPVTTNEPQNTTSHLVIVPDDIQVDDQLIVVGSIRQGVSDFDFGGNFVLVDSFNDGVHTLVIGRAFLGGGEGGQVRSIGTVGATTSAWVTFRIRGVEVSPRIFGIGGTVTGQSVTVDPPSVTGPFDKNLFVAFMSATDDDETVIGFPAGYTHMQASVVSGGVAAIGANSGATVGVAARQFESATDDPGPFTLDGSSGPSGEAFNTVTLIFAPIPPVVVTLDLATEVDQAFNVTAELVDNQPPVVVTLDLATEVGEAFDLNVVENVIVVTLDVAEEIDQAFEVGGVNEEFIPDPEFPDATLDMRVELAFEPADNPLDIVWVDVSDRLLHQSVSLRRGRADESGQVQPSTVTLTLDNNDGALMPGNPNSPFFPNVRRGMPMRISLPGDVPALNIPGIDGSHCFTPNGEDFRADTFDIRMRLLPDRWSTGMRFNEGGVRDTTSIRQTVISRGATNRFSWEIDLRTAGYVQMNVSRDGINKLGSTPNEITAALRPVWVGVTHEANIPESPLRTINYYQFDGDVPPSDITEWTFITRTSAVDSPFTVFHANEGAVRLGVNQSEEAGFRGRILQAEIRDGVNGAIVADPNFTIQSPGVPSFTDSAGKVWTVAGDAEISTFRPRFVGTVDSIVPTWPHGDNNAAGPGPSESRVQLTASGVLRRLSQGNKPLRSSIFRNVTSPRYAEDVVAYWPCEDGQSATSLFSAVGGAPSISIFGIDPGRNDDLISSGPLPVIDFRRDGIQRWRVLDVPQPPPEVSDQWAVEMTFNLATSLPQEQLPTSGNGLQLISIETLASRSIGQFVLFYFPPDQIVMRVYDRFRGNLLENSATTVGPEVLNGFVALDIRVSQINANTIQWAWNLANLDIGLGGGASGQVAGTVGPVRLLSQVAQFDVEGFDSFTFGHIIVHTGRLPRTWQLGADSAWVGESAAHRMFRLATEEGQVIEIVGDDTVFFDRLSAPAGFAAEFGDLRRSEPMGAQRQRDFLALIRECAAVDRGVLLSRRGAPGLVYRTRQTLERQRPALALSGERNEIAVPLTPRLDDQRIRNDVIVTSEGGSSDGVTAPVSIRDEGLYAIEETINGVGGVAVQREVLDFAPYLRQAVRQQNGFQSHFVLAFGVIDGLRIPTLTIDLAASAHILPAYHSLEIGDRVTLDGLPSQFPADTIELIVEAIRDDLTNASWKATLTCSPGDPYLVGILSDGVNRGTPLGAGATFLHEPLEEGEELSVFDIETQFDELPWSTNPADYPVDILVGGERMRVVVLNEVPGTNRFNVVAVRSQNGVVKSHPALEPVLIVGEFRLALGFGSHIPPLE